MFNAAIALCLGLLLGAALSLTHLLRPLEALVPGLVLTLVAYGMLARRTFRQLEATFQRASGSLQQMPPKFAQAVGVMQGAYALAPRQFGVRSQIDTQIGVLYFLQKDYSRALPYLQRSLLFGYWLGGAMLGVIYYKKKDHAQMRKTFAVVTRRGKKQGLVWSLYAYLLLQIGDREAAQRTLAEGKRKVKDDPRLGEALLALQNNKKLRMKAYKEQWYQFHLERPPQEMHSGMGNQKMARSARRGRW